MPPVPVIASYGNEGQAPVTDSMIAHFTKRGFKGPKNDTSLAVSVEGAIYEGGASFNDYNYRRKGAFFAASRKKPGFPGLRRLRGRSAPLQSLLRNGGSRVSKHGVLRIRLCQNPEN
jgi:hypothetical protein